MYKSIAEFCNENGVSYMIGSYSVGDGASQQMKKYMRVSLRYKGKAITRTLNYDTIQKVRNDKAYLNAILSKMLKLLLLSVSQSTSNII